MNKGDTMRPILAGLLCALAVVPADAAAPGQLRQLRAALARARQQIAEQAEAIRAQDARLRVLEARLPVQSAAVPQPTSLGAPGAATPNGSPVQTASNEPVAPITARPGQTAPATPLEHVGEAPPQFEDMPRIAVLGDQGNLITRRGQLEAEFGLEYARADRNTALFRGVEVVQSVLIGAFDINESRQDLVTVSGALRYGLSDRLEIGARLPFVYRSDGSVGAPVQGSTSDDNAETSATSAHAANIGDLELSARYQLTRARSDRPFLVASVQAVLPTGTNPFDLPRDSLGREEKAATGAGFYGITPGITAILPTDPAVIFGTIGYTFNLPVHVHASIPPVLVDYVDPGDTISASMGIGLALNPRTSINFGYAHTFAFGTRTRMRLLDPQGQANPETFATSRELQIGRFLFGVNYRVTDRASLNWSVEVGATQDAPDVRTVLRIPITLLTGG